jgi:ABC-type Zn uptake system ZnuABC Zn-binding protein ZnuA
MRSSYLRVLAALLVMLALPVAAAAAPLKVVATFSTLGSLVQAVGGSRVTVTNLVPIGASPEDYQSTPGDIRTLASAAVLFENGGGIESWLDRTIRNAGNANLHTIVLSDGIPLRREDRRRAHRRRPRRPHGVRRQRPHVRRATR